MNTVFLQKFTTWFADLDGSGKVTAFDAQILAEARAGLRQLTDAQWQSLGTLTTSDIVDFVLGRFTESATT